jgi:hypothetical protein
MYHAWHLCHVSITTATNFQKVITSYNATITEKMFIRKERLFPFYFHTL